MDDGVGADEVQPRSARLQTDQEHVGFAGFKAVAEPLAVLCPAGQREVLDLLVLETVGDDLQHRRELAEDEDPVTLLELCADQREDRLGLSARLDEARRFHLDQLGVAAQLSKLHQRVEDRDGRTCEALLTDRVSNLRVGRDADRFVELTLLALQLDGPEHFGLRR